MEYRKSGHWPQRSKINQTNSNNDLLLLWVNGGCITPCNDATMHTSTPPIPLPGKISISRHNFFIRYEIILFLIYPNEWDIPFCKNYPGGRIRRVIPLPIDSPWHYSIISISLNSCTLSFLSEIQPCTYFTTIHCVLWLSWEVWMLYCE